MKLFYTKFYTTVNVFIQTLCRSSVIKVMGPTLQRGQEEIIYDKKLDQV